LLASAPAHTVLARISTNEKSDKPLILPKIIGALQVSICDTTTTNNNSSNKIVMMVMMMIMAMMTL